MTTLIVYYSLSGNTRTVALALAEQLGADVEELRCTRYTKGFWGFLRAGGDSWRDRLPSIEPLSRDPSSYDLVVIAGPIWAFHPATPVRVFLRQFAGKLHDVAFLLTHGGSAGEKALREMERLAGKPPAGKLVVQEAAVRSGTFRTALSSFAAALRTEVLA